MQTRSIISQLHTAVRNPTALLLGGACGALVPLGTCYVTHELLHGDLVQLSILPLLVLGGLVFSCLSVYAFARAVFGSWYKALGFVIAVEGYMTCTAGWLSVTALVFLIVINAIANGCRVAAEREAELRRGADRAAKRRGSARSAAPRRAAGAVALSLVADWTSGEREGH